MAPADPGKPKRKYPSGAEKRKRKYQREQAPQEAKRRARAAAPPRTDAAGAPQPESGPQLDPVVEFEKVGAPPLDDTASLIRWGAKMLATSVYLAAMDPDLPLNDKLRFVNDASAKLGMIRDKATEQEKLDRAAKAFDQKRGKAQKPTGGPKSLAGVQKPATARRTSA